MSDQPNITQLLQRARNGDRAAGEELLPLVYQELRRIARRERPGAVPDTLNTTVIVHEVYLKLFGRESSSFADRQHFFSVVCLAMRQILRDHARRRSALKRGGAQVALDLSEHDAAVEQDLDSFLALDEALQQLRELDPRLAELVEFRYFAGLSVAELAQLRGCAERTIQRDWRKARAFLQTCIEPQ